MIDLAAGFGLPHGGDHETQSVLVGGVSISDHNAHGALALDAYLKQPFASLAGLLDRGAKGRPEHR